MADYLRGHPDFPKGIKDGVLRHDGDGGLLFVKSKASVMPLPGQTRPADIEIHLPALELRAVSVGALRESSKIALGGIAPVGDDLMVGLGGVLGGTETGAITCVIERAGERHVVFFWAEAGAARSLVEGFARDRVAMGLRPLPLIEHLDANTDAIDRVERRDQQLANIEKHLERQTELLEEIVEALTRR